MNQLVQLVNEWDKYEQSHSGADIANFCRYYLASQDVPENKKIVGGHIPPTANSTFFKLTGHILSLFKIYQDAAIKKAGLPFTEEFYYMNVLYRMGEAKKTEVIGALHVEYTTGMDSIKKLIDLQLISERPHAEDKRAKQIQLTAEGVKLLQETYPYMRKASDMFLKDISQDTVNLCINLLSPVEVANSELAPSVRGMDFDEMYEKVMKAGG